VEVENECAADRPNECIEDDAKKTASAYSHISSVHQDRTQAKISAKTHSIFNPFTNFNKKSNEKKSGTSNNNIIINTTWKMKKDHGWTTCETSRDYKDEAY